MPDTRTSERQAAAGTIECATWLSRCVLLVVETARQRSPGTQVTLFQDGKSLAAGCLCFPLPPAGEDRPGRDLLMMTLPPRSHSLRRGDRIATRAGETETELGWIALRERLVEPKTLIRNYLAPLGPSERASALKFLAQSLAGQGRHAAMQLSETLFAIRAGLREHMPVYVHSPDQPRGLAVESIMAVDDTSFYLDGWLREEEGAVARLTAVSPEGDRAELADHLFHYRRADVTEFFAGGVQSRLDPDEKAGFIAFFELDSPSYLSTGWVLEMENDDGVGVEAHIGSVVRDPVAVRNRILSDPARERLPNDQMMQHHVMPAMLRIQEQVQRETKVESVTAFGTPAADPGVSIIIPLYRRIDLIEQQLAEFTQDRELWNADIIYVLDSPEQKDELIDLASRLYPIYGVPMRIAALQRNVGFSNANNAGASIARGRLLLLMNSDVLPDEPGWLSTMVEFYDSTPDIGAMTPKLLYEDDSIQHAGMYFFQPPGTTLWLDGHYQKGLHRDFPSANVARPVPMLSGACMMISRALYEELGGLRSRYVQGDYEDSDLCMRLRERGLANWYFPGVALYHLEALSYVPDLRMPANRYNAWLHTHLWRHQIESLTQDNGNSWTAGERGVPPSNSG